MTVNTWKHKYTKPNIFTTPKPSEQKYGKFLLPPKEVFRLGWPAHPNSWDAKGIPSKRWNDEQATLHSHIH